MAPGEVRLTVKADVSALRDGSWVKLSLETPGQPAPPSTAPTDRRMQVLARLVDVAADATGSTADFVASTRREYPDVFADLERHLRQVDAEIKKEDRLAGDLDLVTFSDKWDAGRMLVEVLDMCDREAALYDGAAHRAIRSLAARIRGLATNEPTFDRVADERASLRRIREMLAPMLSLGFDEECAEVMVDRATRIPRAAVLRGCPAEIVARGWTVCMPVAHGDGTWAPGAILAGHECKEWGTSLNVPDGTVGDSDRGLDVALSMLEAS